MREQTEVSLKITSTTLTPQDIEVQIGLKPNEAWKIGDRRGVFGAVAKENGFVVETDMANFASFTDCMDALIKKISPYAQKIGEIAPQCEIEFACMLHRKAAPVVRIERDDVRWLGVMGARLCIDTFLVSDGPKGGGAKSLFGGAEGAGAGPAKP